MVHTIFKVSLPTLMLAIASVLFASRNAMAQDGLNDIVSSFIEYDLNQDGANEIEQLNIIPDPDSSNKKIKTDDNILLILVEDRLLKNDETFGDQKLKSTLQQYAHSLADDHWEPIIVRTKVYAGEIHQDGRTVLALRRFFKSVKKSYPNFAGAVLIGSFPESMLVRRWVWKHNSRAATFNGVTYNKGNGPKATFLAMDPELISHRSDVVLCDLDGNWEDIYIQNKTGIDLIKLLPDESITAQPSWPSFDQTIATDKFTIKQKSYEDFFFIDDATMEIVEQTDKKLTIKCDYEMARPEVGEADRSTVNPLAQPDIMVSRINPLHVAVVQPEKNLDSDGKPKPTPKSGGSPNRQFSRDAAFERRLLIEYLQRNINHRSANTPPEAMKVASMWTDLQTPSKRYLGNIAKQLGGIDTFPKANAVDFARFMKNPALVKGVSAHSNPTCSVLMGGYSQAELLTQTGGNYWFWQAEKDQYVPSYKHSSVRNRVHFALLRTLYENGQLPENTGTFYIHGGCEAISPQNAAKLPYNSPNYGGHGQIAESLMYYGNGLALIGRAKVYFDIPRGFDNAFGIDHGNFGDILKTYFEIEANDKGLANSVASRNRTYFWSILGDWTLRLNYEKAVETSIEYNDQPQTFVIRPERLEWIQGQIESGNKPVVNALKKLIADADAILETEPVTVTDDDVVPPSGDKHDYISFGIYWWPNPDTKNGLPYVRRDGESNPEARPPDSDHEKLKAFILNVETLALAYHFKNDERYAKKAVEYLDTFLLDPKTRMNPNLEFAGAIPGRRKGGGSGTIDARRFSMVVDSIQLLKTSESLTQQQYEGLKNWYRQYLQWLIESLNGKAASELKNNLGTFYDVQVVSISLFTGNKELASKTAQAAVEKRLKAQIKDDGSQPKELVRSISYTYSLTNLRGMYRLARLAEHVDVDFWQVSNSAKEPLLLKAFLYMAPHFGSHEFWPHRQLNRMESHNPPYFLMMEASKHYPSELIDNTRERYFKEIVNLRMLLR